MYKFSSNSDFDFGIESVRAMYGGFKTQEFQKRAGAKQFLKVAKTKGQTDLHIIAVGAYEGTGFNRNGDCFKQHWCEKNAHYFKDSDRCVHRHHKNKPEDPKYGNVKAAAYNPDMKRIELVVGLDDDKCADIIQEQEKQGHTNWSMASKQAYDICTACGHKAASDDERCEHIPSQIGEILKSGEMVGMDNPNPRWFEISYVRRPADRIGMSLSKVASDKSIRPMLPRDYLALYPDFSAPADDTLLISKKASDKRTVVDKMAEIEKHIAASGIEVLEAKKVVKTEKIAEAVIDELRKLEPSRFFKVAADAGIILSPENFCHYVFGDRIKEAGCVDSVRRGVERTFRFMDSELSAKLANNERYEPASVAVISNDERNTVKKIAMTHSLLPAYTNARMVQTVSTPIKYVGSDSNNTAFGDKLAAEYMAYKVAALNYLDEQNKLTDDLLFNVVLQNHCI